MRSLILFALLMFLSCTTTESQESVADPNSKAQEAIRPVPKMAICTRDINEHGNPSVCSCDEGYQYNSEHYRCDKR